MSDRPSDQVEEPNVAWLTDGERLITRGGEQDRRVLPIASSEPGEDKLVLPLMGNTQFIYELCLARLEAAALAGDPGIQVLSDFRRVAVRRDRADGDLLSRRLAYFDSVAGEPTDYRRLQRYNITTSVNQYLTHWFYPYKGKFHPQVIRALLNIMRVPSGATVLDPFSGVGTAGVESVLLGINYIGTDISEVATRVARAKLHAYKHLPAIEGEFDRTLEHPPFSRRDEPSQATLIEDLGGCREIEQDSEADNFFVVASLIAHSDRSRRGREFLKAYQTACRKMLDSVQKMARAISDLGIRPGEARLLREDVRRLPLGDETVDCIVTSPPYSIALNYVENDKHALGALGYDVASVKDDFIGVRGTGEAKVTAYEDDMRLAIHEMARVLKPGGRCAIIIGNPTRLAEEIKADDLMDLYCREAGLLPWDDEKLGMSHKLDKIVFGLYNFIQVEYILFFRKPGDGAVILGE